jgi:heme-degrading monooxygenase HmoA
MYAGCIHRDSELDAVQATPSAPKGVGGVFSALPPAPSYAALLLAQWRPAAVPWGWSRLALGTRSLRGTPGLRLAHVLGSGHQGGFGLRPSFNRQGLITFFDTANHAAQFLYANEVPEAWRDRAQESMSLLLRATASRGAWGGVALVGTGEARRRITVASLTRASIRASRAHEFWRHAGASQAAVAQAPGCRLAVGLGEAPLLRQATFSVWDNEAALEAYAHSGAHRGAAQGAWQREWFSESMFARFEVMAATGCWRGLPLQID